MKIKLFADEMSLDQFKETLKNFGFDDKQVKEITRSLEQIQIPKSVVSHIIENLGVPETDGVLYVCSKDLDLSEDAIESMVEQLMNKGMDPDEARSLSERVVLSSAVKKRQ